MLSPEAKHLIDKIKGLEVDAPSVPLDANRMLEWVALAIEHYKTCDKDDHSDCPPIREIRRGK